MSDDRDPDYSGPQVVDLAPPDKTRAALEELRRNLTTVFEGAELLAKVRRANYLALIREGFTEAQALDLCWR